MYNNIKKLINTDNLKKIYVKFIKLPIYYKVLVSIILSLILHFSFTALLHVGMYNYTLLYKIPFSSIENFNFNLFLIPFYFDISGDIWFMFSLLFGSYLITIIFNLYLNKENRFSLKKTIIRIYKSLRNDPGVKYLNKNDRKNAINSSITFMIIISVSIFFISFNLGGIYYWVITSLIAIFLGYYFAYAKNKLTFKLLFPLLILFIIISSFSIVSSYKISKYLTSTRLGGNLPLSLKIKDKYFDGFLLLRTKERIYMYDVNKTFISEFKVDSIDKLTYYKSNIYKDKSIEKNMTYYNSSPWSGVVSWDEVNFTDFHKGYK